MALLDEVYNYIENSYKEKRTNLFVGIEYFWHKSGICSPANEKANRRWTIKTF